MQTLRKVSNEEIKNLLDVICKEDEDRLNMLDPKVRSAYFDRMRAGVASLEEMLKKSGILPND